MKKPNNLPICELKGLLRAMKVVGCTQEKRREIISKNQQILYPPILTRIKENYFEIYHFIAPAGAYLELR